MKTASEMTYIVSSGALNSTQTKPNPVMNSLIRIQQLREQHLFPLACVIHKTERKRPAPG